MTKLWSSACPTRSCPTRRSASPPIPPRRWGIRFGETIKSYIAEGRDLNSLVSIPLALAGWMRYLLAVDDEGKAFEVSADPLKDELQAKLAGIEVGKPETYQGQLKGILNNASIFGRRSDRHPRWPTRSRTTLSPNWPAPALCARRCTTR